MLIRVVTGILLCCAVLALAGPSHAQETVRQFPVGLTPGGIMRPNPPFMVVDPATNKAFVPFQAPVPPPNDAPSPFNNPFPLSPNSQPTEGRASAPGSYAMRVTEVPGQWVYSLQYVPGIGSTERDLRMADGVDARLHGDGDRGGVSLLQPLGAAAHRVRLGGGAGHVRSALALSPSRAGTTTG